MMDLNRAEFQEFLLEEMETIFEKMSKADADMVKAFQKKHGFEVGSAGAKTAAEEAGEEEEIKAKAQRDTDVEMAADHPTSSPPEEGPKDLQSMLDNATQAYRKSSTYQGDFGPIRSLGGGKRLKGTAAQETREAVLTEFLPYLSDYIKLGAPGATEPEAQPGDEEGDQPGPEAEKTSQLPKETPLSIMKRQKGLNVGPKGQREVPLVTQLQDLGLSQSSSQQLAKRIGQYLKQRKIPIAEGIRYIIENNLLLEAPAFPGKKAMNNIKSSVFMGISRQDDTANKKSIKIWNLYFKRVKKGQAPDVAGFKEYVKKYTTAGRKPDYDEEALSEEEWGVLLKHVAGGSDDPDSKKFEEKHEGLKAWREEKAAAKAATRKDIRGGSVGALQKKIKSLKSDLAYKDSSGVSPLKPHQVREKEKQIKTLQRQVDQASGMVKGDVLSKIMSRFVSDNQGLLDKDPKLKAIFVPADEKDRVAANKFRKAVKTSLKMQLKRRGYAGDEIGKFLQENQNYALNEIGRLAIKEVTINGIMESTKEISNTLSPTDVLRAFQESRKLYEAGTIEDPREWFRYKLKDYLQEMTTIGGGGVAGFAGPLEGGDDQEEPQNNPLTVTEEEGEE